MTSLLYLLAAVAANIAAASAVSVNSSTPTIVLEHGTVHGDSCPNSAVNIYQGVPYAQPPVDELRFMPPKPLVGRYSGGRLNATRSPAPCIQWQSLFAVTSPLPSEDCLYLNVYTPKHVLKKKGMPVKVWAYGGGNGGDALTFPLYDGCNLATDSVVVTFNYRLGPLGFMSLNEAGIQGNMAIQDYLAVLHWVQHNIGAFGGDRSKVMLFGQSAGADDAFVVSTLPEVKSLVSSMVLQSGGGQDLLSLENAQVVGASFAAAAGCASTNASQCTVIIACLQSKSVDELQVALTNTAALAKQSPIAAMFGVNMPQSLDMASSVLDGKIIQREPLETGSQVPILSGFNQDDSMLFVLPAYEHGGIITESNYTQFLSAWGSASHAIGQVYPLSKFNGTGRTSDAVVTTISHIITTTSFACPSFKTLRAAKRAKTPAFAYRFDRTPSCPWLLVGGQEVPAKPLLPYFRSAHTAEIPFVFGNMDREPFGQGNCSFSESDRAVSSTLISAWTSMAARASPSTLKRNWPRFDSCNGRGLYIGDEISAKTLDFDECAFWDEIWADMGGRRVPLPDKNACSTCLV